MLNRNPHKKTEEVRAIYSLHHVHLHNIAFRYLQDHALADDIVHDCMLKLLENYADYRLHDAQQAKGLVVKIVIGLSLDALRKRKREIVKEIDESYPSPENPEEILHDQAEYFLSLIGSDDAKILRMNILHGYSNAEIAKREGISEPALRKRMQRARERLQKAVTEDFLRENASTRDRCERGEPK